MDDEKFSKILIGGLICFIAIVVIVNLHFHYLEVNIDTHAKIAVKYCDGERDTLDVYFKGSIDNVEIVNTGSRYSHKAVPEFRAYKQQILAYNVCWFKIISYEEKK